MPHEISQEELDELNTKLNALDLSDAQRALLNAVLQIAWDCVGSHASLDAEFNGSFEPGEAASIMAYQHSAHHDSITRSVGPSSITRAVRP
jgi:hypothetical protein